MKSNLKKKAPHTEKLSNTPVEGMLLDNRQIYEGYLKHFFLLLENTRKEEIALIAKLDKEFNELKISDNSELQKYKEASLMRTLKYTDLIFKKILENYLQELIKEEDTCMISDLRSFYSKNSSIKSA